MPYLLEYTAMKSFDGNGMPKSTRHGNWVPDITRRNYTGVFRIMNWDDKIDKTVFWTMEEPRQGAGRRRFKEKEIRRNVAAQRKDVRK